jgi:Ca-activated chloride channel family protein
MTRFVRHPEDVYAALGLIVPQGWTALLDAVCLGIHQMKRASNGRRVLLVLSDGADNNSRYSTSEVREMVREADTQIYAIGLFTRARPLQQLTEESGGRLLEVRNLAELPEMLQTLSTEIRNQYLLGYSSSNQGNDGKYRKVKVELVQTSAVPALHLSWRRGYYAPQE